MLEHICLSPGLQPFCGRVQKGTSTLDHEAHSESPRPRHLSHQQAVSSRCASLLVLLRDRNNKMRADMPSTNTLGIGCYLHHLQVKKWASSNVPAAMRPQTENYVVSRYIEDPLLIGGKKFDLRMYVVVLNYKPLQASQP